MQVTTSFRTALAAMPAAWQLTHTDTLLAIGSCFTEHIGNRLAAYKFPTVVNPFGIVYNPASMAESLDFLLSEKIFTPADLFMQQGVWHSWLHHGDFSHTDPVVALEGMNHALERARAHLAQCTHLLLTLGTAKVYTFRQDNRLVANCHKVPAHAFDTHLLSVQSITHTLCAQLERLRLARPALKVILTVSPVRHIADGFVQNQRSKATLLLAAAACAETLPDVHYFPAYELMMDDLRDYRFYDADMLHPNTVAIDYIWAHFSATYFSEATRQVLRQLDKLMAATRHRPFHPTSAAHQAFLQTQLQAMAQLQTTFPHFDFSAEAAILRQHLKDN